MSDLSDFKRRVYEPEIAALKQQVANRSAVIVRLERVIDTLQAQRAAATSQIAAASDSRARLDDLLVAAEERIATLERNEARAQAGLVGSAGSDRDPDTSGASPEGNDGGQALPTSLADALEDLADARASAEAARAMRDRHEERYEKHKARADRYEKALKEIANSNWQEVAVPVPRAGGLRKIARAALAGEDA